MRKLMSVYLSILLVLIIMGTCNGQPPTNPYDFAWDLNPDPEQVDHYDVYVWVGFDTVGVDSSNFSYYKSFGHDSLKVIYPSGNVDLIDEYPSVSDGAWIAVGGYAIDNTGDRSGFGQSPFLQKEDLLVPTKVSGWKVTK